MAYINTKLSGLRVVFMLSLAFTTCFNSTAQKLPGKQNASIWSPQNIKIDGKNTEWGSQFQAYNRATEIYYTVANDGDHLYFLIQARDPHIINKIYSNGLTLMIGAAGQKNDKKSLKILYPVYENGHRFRVRAADKPTSPAESELFIKAANKLFTSEANAIQVSWPGVKDSLISLYNDDGIKVRALFDDKMFYTCEIAVDLNKLDFLPKNQNVFSYHVILRPLNAKQIDNITRTTGLNEQGKVIPMTRIDVSTDMSTFRNLISTTDFRGEYTLAKKP